MQDQYQAARNTAVGEGNADLVKTLDSNWSDEKKAFGALNPLWAEKRAGGETIRIEAGRKLHVLQKMIDAGDVPSNIQPSVLKNMIQAYNNYEAWLTPLKGQTDNLTMSMRSQAANRFIGYMAHIVQAYPEVTAVYNGVFRQLDQNLDTTAVINQTQGGQ